MIFDVNGKSFAVGLEWRTQVVSGGISTIVRKAKAKWYWHSDPAVSYGILSPDDHKAKFKLPVFSAMIALTQCHQEVNLLAIISIPDTEYYAVLGVVSGRPLSNFDFVIDSLDGIGGIIENFKSHCKDQPCGLLGDIDHEDFSLITFDDLSAHATEYAKLKKVTSGIATPLTILIVIGILGFVGHFGWKKFIEYRKQEAQKKIEANQKSAQELYDEMIVMKRNEWVLLAKDADSLKSAVGQLPAKISEWSLESGKCNSSQTKQFVCRLRFARLEASVANNENFHLISKKHNLSAVTFMPDLKTIEATFTIDGLPFNLMSIVLDSAIPQEDEWIKFGTQLQKLLPFGTPTIQQFDPYALPVGVDSSQLIKPPYMVSKWSPSGPIRMLDLLNTFPKYSTIDELKFTIGKTPQLAINQSIVTVVLVGSAFSKQKN